jgi:hypothetical protein
VARISGIDLPREKRIEIALTYIFGIGLPTAQKLLAKTGVDGNVRVKDLSAHRCRQEEGHEALSVRASSRREHQPRGWCFFVRATLTSSILGMRGTRVKREYRLRPRE